MILYSLGYLFYILRYSFIPAFIIIALQHQFHRYMRKYEEKLHKDKGKIHDKRNEKATEVLTNIKSIKLYSWTEHFEKEIYA